MRRARAGALLFLALLAGGFAVAQTQPQPWRADQRPTTRMQNCTTAGCHAREVSHKFLHGPAAVSACDMCHTSKDPAAHTFQIKTEGKDLCTFCHMNHSHTNIRVPHEPYAKGDCLSCHDPHGGATRSLLNKPDTNSLCLSCHDQVLRGGTHTHKPVHDGACTDCHKSHGADHAKLLLKPGRAMCLSCHDQVQHTLAGSPHAHKPMEGDCLQCHTAHTSASPMQLKQMPKDLCLTCHDDVAKVAMNASHPHSAVLEGQACLNCHQPHASKKPKLTKDDPTAACLACHRDPDKPKAAASNEPPKPVFRSDLQRQAAAGAPKVQRLAKPVREFKGALSLSDLHAHAPVGDGDCAACHNVHGGDRPDLLKASYSIDFYQPFTTDAFALCFNCHDTKLVTTQHTESDTGFRDGARNLHYLHVNRDQGRNCRACHTVHASRHEVQIRETASYGNWELPINFVKTETGGSCAVGCHREYSYDRVTPVHEMPLPPGSPPAPVLNR
jgi:predicted CXXCH cytochrome family protein